MEIELLGKRPELLPTIARWLFNEFTHLEPAVTPSIIEDRLKARLTLSNCSVTWVCLYNKQLAGTASLIDSDGVGACEHLSPWLADVYVHPPFRRLGIGAMLSESVARHAERSGFRKLYLYTEDRQTFFERLGWVESMQVKHHGHTVSIMGIHLPSSNLHVET